MSVGKKCSRSGKSIEVRRPGIRVPLEAAKPVILIINRNEKDVRFGPKGEAHKEEATHQKPENATHMLSLRVSYAIHVRKLK